MKKTSIKEPWDNTVKKEYQAAQARMFNPVKVMKEPILILVSEKPKMDGAEINEKRNNK